MNYRLGVLLGKLANGFQLDHGNKVHAVILKKCKRPPCPYNDFGKKVIENDDYATYIGLCGVKPGRKSIGWSYDEKDFTGVSCPRCIAKLKKLNKERVMKDLLNQVDDMVKE